MAVCKLSVRPLDRGEAMLTSPLLTTTCSLCHPYPKPQQQQQQQQQQRRRRRRRRCIHQQHEEERPLCLRQSTTVETAVAVVGAVGHCGDGRGQPAEGPRGEGCVWMDGWMDGWIDW